MVQIAIPYPSFPSLSDTVPLPDIFFFPEFHNPKEKNKASLFLSQNLLHPNIESFCYKFIKRFEKHSAIAPKKHTGRHPKLGVHKDRQLG